MKALEPPDSHYVSAAVGWLELGNAHEPAAELQAVASPLARHPAVLQTWYEQDPDLEPLRPEIKLL